MSPCAKKGQSSKKSRSNNNSEMNINKNHFQIKSAIKEQQFKSRQKQKEKRKRKELKSFWSQCLLIGVLSRPIKFGESWRALTSSIIRQNKCQYFVLLSFFALFRDNTRITLFDTEKVEVNTFFNAIGLFLHARALEFWDPNQLYNVLVLLKYICFQTEYPNIQPAKSSIIAWCFCFRAITTTATQITAPTECNRIPNEYVQSLAAQIGKRWGTILSNGL